MSSQINIGSGVLAQPTVRCGLRNRTPDPYGTSYPIHVFNPLSIDRTSAVLDSILDPQTHLALWQRKRPQSLVWIDDLSWDEIDDIDCTIRVSQCAREISEALRDAGYSSDLQINDLALEITSLVTLFARIMTADRINVRFEIVETDACRKFHADVVTARLLSTLSGRATQWIETSQPDEIHEMTVGDVAIFKGRLWADEPTILHRSPPIAGLGQRRLLLSINSSHNPVSRCYDGKPR